MQPDYYDKLVAEYEAARDETTKQILQQYKSSKAASSSEEVVQEEAGADDAARKEDEGELDADSQVMDGASDVERSLAKLMGDTEEGTLSRTTNVLMGTCNTTSRSGRSIRRRMFFDEIQST